MKTSTTVCSVIAVLLILSPVQAFQLRDGNFDSLTVGTPPDDGTPAGAWQIPQNYIDGGVGEGSQTTTFTIVSTDSFDPGADGNSFHVNSSFLGYNPHVTNLFDTAVTTELIFGFDSYVPTGGGNGAIYLAGDHGGGGYNNMIDRGPQLSLLSNGEIRASTLDDPLNIVGTFDFDQWLRFELHVSLIDDDYDIFFGPRGGNLSLLASDVGFRSGGLDFLDRASFAHFGGANGPSNQYFDNLKIIPEPSSTALLGVCLIVGWMRRRR